jgi:NDP-sugar pyrophosphorylase family protein
LFTALNGLVAFQNSIRNSCDLPLVNTFYYRIVSYIDLFLRDEQTNGNGWHRAEAIRLEQDIFTALAGQGKLYVYKTPAFWSQIKSAG